MKAYEMKDSGFSDLGRCPSHWKVEKIKNGFSIVCGATPTEDPENWEGEISWIGPADMGDFGKISKGRRSITHKGYNSCGTTLVPSGSVVLSTRAPIGKIQIAASELCTNQGCKCLLPKQGNHLTSFLSYYLFAIKERLQILGTGTTFKELSTTNLANVPYLLPPLPEQQAAIASYLDEKCAAIDDIVARAKETIEEYKQWKASVIFEAVTKGLDKNAEMKDSGVEWIGQVPKGWEISRLKSKVKHLTIVTHTPTGYIGLENIQSGSGTYIESSESDFQTEGQALVIRKGNVIFGKLRPYLAKCYLVENDGCCSSEFLVLSSTQMDSKYLKYLMLSPAFINEVNMATYGTKMPRANWEIVSCIQSPFPPLPEQQAIASYLDEKCAAIDAVVARKQSLIEELESYKKSLIFEVVTGKRRVC